MPKASGDFTTRVEGLDEFRKALRNLGPDMQKKLGQANKEAADIVATSARSKAERLGGVHRHVAPSIKASAAARQASVVLGGSRYPMAFGAEFGSIAFQQFPPWRGNQFQLDASNVGYIVHPAAREKVDEVVDTYDAAIRRVAALAFPD
jgi:hypothetical protein